MSLVNVDTTSTLESVLTFVGPLVGVVVGAVGSWRVARSRDVQAEKIELTRALGNYMAAAEVVAVELGSFPESSWLERRIDELLPSPRRVGAFVQRVMGRLAFGETHERLRLLYQQARAELVLIAPIEIIGVVLRVDDFLVEWQTNRSDDMKRRWADLSGELRLTAQRTIDKGLGRPYRAGETRINFTRVPGRGRSRKKGTGG